MSKCEDLAMRLQGIRWNRKDLRRRSQKRLLHEYLRRSALWAQKINGAAWPFYDVAELIDPSIRAPQALAKETLMHLSKGATYYVSRTAEWALHFARL